MGHAGNPRILARSYFRRNLIRLSANDLTTPIVFFCTADCWQSWNASVRASQWGYTAVHWYPTGSDGWTEAGGELIPEARILITDQAGESFDIGRVQFVSGEAGQYGIDVEVESELFNDHFLSMRPFKCLDGAAEWYCHQPYLYELNNVVTEDDVSDLEYQLLFIRKSAKEFGIDAWNGLYFKLARGEDGIWRGTLLEGDLNVLQSPPPEGVKPIDLFEFIDADIDQRRYIELTLQPIL